MGNKVVTRAEASNKDLTAEDIAMIKSSSNLDDLQIQTMHANFMREFPAGRMDKAGFVKLYKQITPRKEKVDTLSDHVFAIFDKNNDGTIDFREFILTVVAGSPRDLDSQLNFVFKTCDVSGDGLMDLEELVKFLKAAVTVAGNPEMATDEQMKPISIAVFKLFGVNETGKITKEQFIQGCKNEPSLKKLFGGKH